MVTLDNSLTIDPYRYLGHLMTFMNDGKECTGIITQGYRDEGGLRFTIRTQQGSVRKHVPLWSIGLLRMNAERVTIGFDNGEILSIIPSKSPFSEETRALAN